MSRYTTFSGKAFAYSGSVHTGIIVSTLDVNGRETGTRVTVDQATIELIREKVRKHGAIKMGACRDNPSRGSLGEFLQGIGKSPQFLSYTLPLLEKEKLISSYKDGKSYWVRWAVPAKL